MLRNIAQTENPIRLLSNDFDYMKHCINLPAQLKAELKGTYRYRHIPESGRVELALMFLKIADGTQNFVPIF